MSLLIKRGQRAVIVGMTGSGKTQMGIAQLKAYPSAPIYVLDTKGDDAIQSFMREQLEIKNAVQVGNVADLAKLAKQKKGVDYVWILPGRVDLQDAERVDAYLDVIYEASRPCLVFVDEAYQVHKNGFAYQGLVGLLTRGRSKGMSLICCTQRPAWLSRFIFTESNQFFIYNLQSNDDYKKLSENGLPILQDLSIINDGKLPKHIRIESFHFYHYISGQQHGRFYSPIPIQHDPGYGGEESENTRWL